MGEAEQVRPFAYGSEYAEWEAANCDGCAKSERLKEGNVYVPSQCEIQRALTDAFWGDGRIDLALYQRSGLPGDHCPERELAEAEARMVALAGAIEANVAECRASWDGAKVQAWDAEQGRGIPLDHDSHCQRCAGLLFALSVPVQELARKFEQGKRDTELVDGLEDRLDKC
jgi:hypothetical protein